MFQQIIDNAIKVKLLQWPGTPFWSDRNAAVYCGDSRELVKLWPRRSVDLVITDPPYGIGFKSGFAAHARIQGDDDRIQIPAMIAATLRPLQDGAHAYIFGFAARELTGLFATAVDLVWDKGSVGMGDLSVQWGVSHEPIVFGVYYPDKANKAVQRGGLTTRLRKGSVLRVPRLNAKQNARHPTEKPVKLLRQLVESSSVVDDLVLDPFAGVGSTGVAAVLLGRRAVCIELDEGYCAEASRRLEAASDLLAKAATL